MTSTFTSILRGVGLSTVGPVFGALLSIVTIKILAISLGPMGTGFYSLLKQFIQTCAVAATLNSQGPITQAVASQQGNERLRLYPIARVLLGVTLLACGVLFVAAHAIASLFPLFEVDYLAFTIRCSIPIVVVAATTSFLTGVLNGYRLLGTLAVGQVAGAVAAALLATPISAWSAEIGMHALLLLLAASQFVALVVYLVQAVRLGLLRRPDSSSSVGIANRLPSRFLAMCATALATGLLAAGSMLLVRALVAKAHGLEGAGVFDAAYTISAGYIGLVLGGFGTYYLPTLAATKGGAERVAFMGRMLWVTTLISGPLFIVLILGQGWVIPQLYSERYLAAGDLLKLLLIGDFLKATAWVFAYLPIAFPNPRMMLASEVMWNLVFVLFTALALHFDYPLKAIGFGYILSHAICLLMVGIFAIRAHQFSASGQLQACWILLFSGVAIVSVMS